MPHDILIDFGLSEKEATVYLALLELGASGASEIAEKTKVNRSSVYVALESLKARGFVTAIATRNPNNLVTVQKFIAASPDALLKAAHDSVQRERELEQRIEVIVPELKALHQDTKHRPKVYFYEGPETIIRGIQRTFEEQTARGMKLFRLYGDASILFSLKSPFADGEFPDATIKRADVVMRVLSPKTPQAQIAAEELRNNGFNGDFAFVSPARFNQFPHDMPAFVIYEDKVGFFSEDSFFVVLENKEMADVLKNIYDLAIVHGLSFSL